MRNIITFRVFFDFLNCKSPFQQLIVSVVVVVDFFFVLLHFKNVSWHISVAEVKFLYATSNPSSGILS